MPEACSLKPEHDEQRVMRLIGRRGVIVRVTVSVALVCLLVAGASAQPDPSQMSGIPRPDPNLPDGVITVRVLRGSFANNVVEHSVELRAGDTVSTVDTDAAGRATFSSPPAGSQVQVATTLDGERLESDLFQAPGRGGVAVMLVGVEPGGDPGCQTRTRDLRSGFADSH